MAVSDNITHLVCMFILALITIAHALTKQSISDLVEADVSLDGFVFVTQTLSTIVLCAQYCIQNTICKSFNYYHVIFLCELSDVTKVEYPGSSRSTSGVFYSEIADWSSKVRMTTILYTTSIFH
jgi:hypothetical protein